MVTKLDERILEYLQKTVVYTDSMGKEYFVNLLSWETSDDSLDEELSTHFCVTNRKLTEDEKKDCEKEQIHTFPKDGEVHISLFLFYTFTAVWSLEENFMAFTQFVHQEMRKGLTPPVIRERHPDTLN
jgi:hypothetical protein